MKKLSGRTSLYQHKFDDWKKYTPSGTDNQGLKKVWFLDAQWSTCPVEVEDEIKNLWMYYELGNDVFMKKTSINKLKVLQSSEELFEKLVDKEWKEVPLKFDNLIPYIESHGIDEDDMVIIHWWW